MIVENQTSAVGLSTNMTSITESRPLFIRLTLPDGLEEALEGLSREVLRHKPEDINEFAAEHFDQLLKRRGYIGKHCHANLKNAGNVFKHLPMDATNLPLLFKNIFAFSQNLISNVALL